MTTSDQQPVLERIAHLLVEQRLAACVQISGPLVSVYRWEGQICSTGEYLATVKTHRSCVDAAIECIQQSHNYSVPEIICIPITAGASRYLEWLRSETVGGGP